MNAHRLRQFLAWAVLSASLLPGLVFAAPAAKAAPPAEDISAQGIAAQKLAAEALRPSAKRSAPRRLDVNQPVQASFETGAVQQAANLFSPGVLR